MRTVAVDIIDSPELLSQLEAEWRALEDSSGNTLPFRTFDWADCWWRHMREHRASVEDRLAIRTLRSSDGRLVGVAPLMITERPGVGPLRTRCLQFIGPDPNMTEIRSALILPGHEASCYRALHDTLQDSLEDVDWLWWTGLPDPWHSVPTLAAPALRWSLDVSSYFLELPASWEELRASRQPNLREALRKCYRLLERDGFSPAVTVVADRRGVEPALEDFYRLHAARALLANTIHHNDVFAHPACRRFLLEACHRFAAQGALRIIRIEVGGKAIACRLAFALGNSLYLYYSGFDPAFAKYSVSTRIVAEACKLAIAEGRRFVCLSTGRDESKLRWRPTEVKFHQAQWVSPHALGRAKYGAYRAVQRFISRSASGPVSTWLARRAPGADVDLRLQGA